MLVVLPLSTPTHTHTHTHTYAVSFSPYFSLKQRVVYNYLVSYNYLQRSLLTEFDTEDVLFLAILISDITDQSKYMNKNVVYYNFKTLISSHGLDSVSFCCHILRSTTLLMSQPYSLYRSTDCFKDHDKIPDSSIFFYLCSKTVN